MGMDKNVISADVSSQVIIDVNDVYKNFRVYYDKGSMLKETFVNPGRSRYEEREILKGITFKVYRGETVALIGQNGCGKSTTLKMLTKILYPNKGTVTVYGKVSSLIELGAGFHPDMSGRENIYINASILGIKKDEVDKRIDEIIRFSELEEFIDNPIRTYSSGMYMRLAFSVAINVDADILLIDEILAVGDQAFQEKCIRKLDELRLSGVTVVLVSHSMSQVKEIADRCIWIEGGQIREDGDTETVCNHYEEAMTRRREERDELEEGQRKVSANDNNGVSPDQINDEADAVIEGDEPAAQDNKKNRRLQKKALRLEERKKMQEAFSFRWQGGGSQGKKAAGVIAMALFMLFFACQNVFGINYDVENKLSFWPKVVGYVSFILGAVGLPMLLILLGFELLERDYSSGEKVYLYYRKTFLPVFIIWETWVLIYQVFLMLWIGRPLDFGVWLREALLIKYIDIPNLWTARFLGLMLLVTPFVARFLQLLSARALQLLLILFWIFIFMFPGFDMYGQANGGEPSFPFYSGTVCYVFYFCVGHLISRYSQRMLKGSKEVLMFVAGFFLSLWSQLFFDNRGVDYLIKPTYFGISIMAIMGFDLLARVKVDEMYPRVAKLIETVYGNLVGIYLIFGVAMMIIGKYLISSAILQEGPHLAFLVIGTVILWILTALISFAIMSAWNRIFKRN
ncbi:ABC transporter ATP-binding protein [Butyrivibrio sp. NC3005]|uniref:ABC transporter ATP-binding protein n=1 Tax=Butyrivibrio sp. NC3005 TaxID=1280685 RepID=UPI0004043EE6|nr:ABC transporter ATP-binding protein [Butyrivibrio sp. NC3005]